jgi:hypothetical protein
MSIEKLPLTIPNQLDSKIDLLKWLQRAIYEPIVIRLNPLLNGADGTFTTADVPAKTVTVKNGVITQIL